MRPSVIRASLTVALLVMFAACASPPTRFYTLSGLSTAPAGTSERALTPVSVGLGPITLPRYLDRSEVVSRASPNRVQLAEFDQWAEPLQDMIPRVMADNLTVLLATDRVFLLPRRTPVALDYQVAVDISRFDLERGNRAVMTARWDVLTADGRESLIGDKVTVTAAAPAQADPQQTYEALVAAMSNNIAELSKEIAEAIRSLPRRRTGA